MKWCLFVTHTSSNNLNVDIAFAFIPLETPLDGLIKAQKIHPWEQRRKESCSVYGWLETGTGTGVCGWVNRARDVTAGNIPEVCPVALSLSSSGIVEARSRSDTDTQHWWEVGIWSSCSSRPWTSPTPCPDSRYLCKRPTQRQNQRILPWRNGEVPGFPEWCWYPQSSPPLLECGPTTWPACWSTPTPSQCGQGGGLAKGAEWGHFRPHGGENTGGMSQQGAWR